MYFLDLKKNILMLENPHVDLIENLNFVKN